MIGNEYEVDEDVVSCDWCGGVYPTSECEYEKDLGCLCNRCSRAIKSRGEALEFAQKE